MDVLYLIVVLLFLTIAMFGWPNLNTLPAQVYWYRNLSKAHCVDKARFLYLLIRFFLMHPEKYNSVSCDRVRWYLLKYLNTTWPCTEEELKMHKAMLQSWYKLRTLKTVPHRSQHIALA